MNTRRWTPPRCRECDAVERDTGRTTCRGRAPTTARMSYPNEENDYHIWGDRRPGLEHYTGRDYAGGAWGSGTMAFLIGVGASLVAGATLWALTHPSEVRYVFIRRQRRSTLAGNWHSYHLTQDSSVGPGTIWVHHEDHVRVGIFGRLRGTSQGTHVKQFSYALSGIAHGPTVQMALVNREAHESRCSIVYPNPLGKDVLVGIWVAEDFDRHWYASPTILSRQVLDEATLVRLTQQIHLNRPSRKGSRPSSTVESPSPT
jgi:hypothetical protein